MLLNPKMLLHSLKLKVCNSKNTMLYSNFTNRFDLGQIRLSRDKNATAVSFNYPCLRTQMPNDLDVDDVFM